MELFAVLGFLCMTSQEWLLQRVAGLNGRMPDMLRSSGASDCEIPSMREGVYNASACYT